MTTDGTTGTQRTARTHGTPGARRGPGRFQWDAGGWFGAQFGSTFWLLMSGAVLLREAPTAGAVALAAFLVANVTGWLLWSRRDRMLPYPAIQWLLAVMGVTATAFVVYVNMAGVVHALDDRLGMGSWGFPFVPLLFVGLMVLFHVLERRGPAGPAKTHDAG